MTNYIWLCIHKDNHYCHAAFDTKRAAVRWCEAHTDYIVAERRIYSHESEVN